MLWVDSLRNDHYRKCSVEASSKDAFTPHVDFNDTHESKQLV